MSISPPAAVFEWAPEKVLHGAVRLHGLASFPVPDTHVRVCACAAVASVRTHTAAAPMLQAKRVCIIALSFIEAEGDPRPGGRGP